MNNQLYKSLGVPFKTGELLKSYTTFNVGGPCRVMFFPNDYEGLKRVVDFSLGNLAVIGNGSNVLISDEGFDGVVINTTKLKKIRLIGNILEAECGAKTCDIVNYLAENCFGGLEFACGIPGTIGGLVVMNGGCFNKSIEDYVCYVKTTSGVLNNSACKFDYRKSELFDKVVYSVGIKVMASERDVIDRKIEHFSSLRRGKQPKGNSCGSVFINDGYFAGKIIDQAGLKGFRIGGAYVSKAHANFIINDGGTADNIYQLIQYIKQTVKNQCGIELKEEVRYIGKFNANYL